MWIFTAAVLVLSVALGHGEENLERVIAGKFVVVTGGARGIGQKIAARCLEKGANLVAIVDKLKDEGEETTKDLNDKYGENKVVFYYGDVITDLETICKDFIAKNYGLPDVVFNNAGIVDVNNPDLTLQTNLLAIIKATTSMYEKTRKDKGGKGCTVVNMSSMYGYFIDPFMPAYKAASGACQSFSKTMGHPYRYNKTGVRVICLNPGFTYTDMTEGQLEEEELADLFTNYSKSWKWQSPDEVASASMHIFEEAPSGSCYTINGGEYYISPASDSYDAEYVQSFEDKSE